MFNNILLVVHEKESLEHLKVVEEVLVLLKDKNFKKINVDKISKEDFLNKDLIITVGGDGTFIKSASFIKNQFIIGINSEPSISEGGLLVLKGNDLNKLKDILRGEYLLNKKDRIAIKRNNQLIEELALNEVYVGTLNQFDTSRYIIQFNKIKEEQRSSGVLVVASSGSSAWYKSAGGKPFLDKNILKFLVREPFFGKLFTPKILNGHIEEGASLFFESKRSSGGVVALDSNNWYDFNLGDKLEIFISKDKLNVLLSKE